MLGFYNRAIMLGFPSNMLFCIALTSINILISILFKGFAIELIIRLNTFINIVCFLMFIERRLLNFPFRLW